MRLLGLLLISLIFAGCSSGSQETTYPENPSPLPDGPPKSITKEMTAPEQGAPE